MTAGTFTRPDAVRSSAPTSRPSRSSRSSRSRARAATTVVVVLLGLFIALNVHEVGHTAVAWLAGDHHASYQLHCEPAGFGCNHFSATGMGTAAKVAVTLGGVVITQLITWSLLLLRRRAGQRWRVLLTPLLAVFAVDPLLQLVQGALTPLPEYDLTKVDFTACATLLGWSQSFSLGVFTVAALGYVAVWVRLGYRARA